MIRSVLAFSFLVLAGCGRVDPGSVGIMVNLYGENRGVDDLTVKTGRVFYNPWSQEMYEFPTYVQNVSWTSDADEGSEVDKSITFNSQEGANINADVGFSYQYPPERVPHVFVDLRKTPREIEDTYLRIKVRDAFSRVGSSMEVMSILGPGKADFLDQVQAMVQEELTSDGDTPDILVDSVTFIGKPRVDQRVEQSINATIEAQQRAIEARNKVQQSKAEADQRIEEARGEAESVKLAALARAEAVLAEAEAQSEANQKLSQSITPQLIQYEGLQRWNGTLPRFLGSEAVPFIQIPDEE